MGQRRTGADGSGHYRDVRASKSVKLPTQMKFKKCESSKSCFATPTAQGEICRPDMVMGGNPLDVLTTIGLTAPERVRFTPKGGNDGLGKTALVNTGACFLLSQ